MANPTGALVGLPLATLQQIQSDAIARINGSVTNVFEAGGSVGKTAGMDPLETLREVAYAIKIANGQRIIRTTRPNFGRCRYGLTAFEEGANGGDC